MSTCPNSHRDSIPKGSAVSVVVSPAHHPGDHGPKPDLSQVDRQGLILIWSDGRWQQTLPLHKSSKVAQMWSAPSNHAFCAFAAQVGEPHIIPNDDVEEGPRQV